MEDVKFLSRPKETVQTLGLGVFDGFHLGHKALADKCDALMTFYPHPEFVLKDDTNLKLLTTLDERKVLFKKIFIIEFTKNFSKMTALEFLETVIKSLPIMTGLRSELISVFQLINPDSVSIE